MNKWAFRIHPIHRLLLAYSHDSHEFSADSALRLGIVSPDSTVAFGRVGTGHQIAGSQSYLTLQLVRRKHRLFVRKFLKP